MTSHIIIYLSANLNPNQALKNEVVVVELTILGADFLSISGDAVKSVNLGSC